MEIHPIKQMKGSIREIFLRSLISFGNTSYQTNERKYSQDFQCKLMISVNSDNQTSFQLFYWNEIREWKFYWKFFHSNFIWLVWLEYFSDIINYYYCIFSFTLQEQHNLRLGGNVCLGKFSQYFLSFVWLDVVFKGNFQEFPEIINFLWKYV